VVQTIECVEVDGRGGCQGLGLEEVDGSGSGSGVRQVLRDLVWLAFLWLSITGQSSVHRGGSLVAFLTFLLLIVFIDLKSCSCGRLTQFTAAGFLKCHYMFPKALVAAEARVGDRDLEAFFHALHMPLLACVPCQA